jgi:enoyl-CoA hydratase/carnithine racemase
MELIRLQREASVGYVTLDRVERRNALDVELVQQLGAALAEVAGDPECSAHANGQAKRIIDMAAEPALEATLDAELTAQLSCIETERFRREAERFRAAPARNLAGAPQ